MLEKETLQIVDESLLYQKPVVGICKEGTLRMKLELKDLVGWGHQVSAQPRKSRHAVSQRQGQSFIEAFGWKLIWRQENDATWKCQDFVVLGPINVTPM